MLLAIIGSHVSIHISPAPVEVKRPTSMKKTLSVEPQLRTKAENKLLANEESISNGVHLPSHVGHGELDMPNARVSRGRYWRSYANQRKRRIGNAQSIAADDAVALAKTSSDYINLPDMFCERENKQHDP